MPVEFTAEIKESSKEQMWGDIAISSAIIIGKQWSMLNGSMELKLIRRSGCPSVSFSVRFNFSVLRQIIPFIMNMFCSLSLFDCPCGKQVFGGPEQNIERNEMCKFASRVSYIIKVSLCNMKIKPLHIT